MAKGSNTEQVEDDFDCDEDDDIFKVKHATPEYFEEHNVAHASSTPIYNQRVVKVLDQVSLYLTIYVSQIPSPPPDFA